LVNGPDSGERRNDAANAIDEQVPPEQTRSADWPVFDSTQAERHERNNYQRVEDHGR
jgi:hypothetical protein